MIGKSAEQQQREAQERAAENQLHQLNLHQDGAKKDERAAEILRYLSEIDDLPIDEDDPIMSQLVSTLTSTANLTKDQIASNEWVIEFLMVLYLSRYPTTEGIHSEWRGYVEDDPDEEIEPLATEDRLKIETFISGPAKLALTRSEDAMVVKESARTISESVVNEKEKEKGGLLGMR